MSASAATPHPSTATCSGGAVSDQDHQAHGKGHYRALLQDHPALEWVERINWVICRKAKSIAALIEVSECRERWLHGELALWGGGFILMNEAVLWTEPAGNERKRPYRVKADLSAPHLVAEIKVFGTDHQSKILDGPGGWSLQDDFERLRKSKIEDRLHLLLLVLVDQGETDLAKRCKAKQFPPGKATELLGLGPQVPGCRVSVRAWQVHPILQKVNL